MMLAQATPAHRHPEMTTQGEYVPVAPSSPPAMPASTTMAVPCLVVVHDRAVERLDARRSISKQRGARCPRD
jgi:hypothetical protein